MAKKKKFALNNSYFKNRRPDDPETPSEVVAFFEEHGELPFAYGGDNWPYDMVCERQKRRGVILSQHLTPDGTARRMAQLAAENSTAQTALDACCGTGQITKFLLERGLEVKAFDCDREMLALHNQFYPQVKAFRQDFKEWSDTTRWPMVVSNPPFDREIAPEFMKWLAKHLEKNGKAVLLLPKGYMEKTRPRSLSAALSSFMVLHREPVAEKFAHTNGIFEIVVLENLDTYR